MAKKNAIDRAIEKVTNEMKALEDVKRRLLDAKDAAPARKPRTKKQTAVAEEK